MTVSILPLTITTVFCYNQITTSLFRQEENALRETLNTAADSLHFQAELYENLLQYVCDSEAVISTSSREYATVYEKYHQFSYVFDVFLNSVMVQHPEVERITLYTDRDDIRHGKQLQLLSDLEAEPWFTEELSDLIAEPQYWSPVCRSRISNTSRPIPTAVWRLLFPGKPSIIFWITSRSAI